MPHGFSQRSMSKRSCHKEVKILLLLVVLLSWLHH